MNKFYTLILRSALLTPAALLLGAAPPDDNLASGFDGHRLPPVLYGSYDFDCGDIRAEIRWRQERTDPDRVADLMQALEVTPLVLSISGRAVSSRDMATLTTVFEDFAWIEQVSATCYDGRIGLEFRIMPLRNWVSHLRGDVEERPRLRTRVILLSIEGIVSIV